MCIGARGIRKGDRWGGNWPAGENFCAKQQGEHEQGKSSVIWPGRPRPLTPGYVWLQGGFPGMHRPAQKHLCCLPVHLCVF